jgi:hypothetical protein
MCSVCSPLATNLFQNVLNTSNVHLNNKDEHNEILHCKTQNICISIYNNCIFNYSDLQCFENDCYRHNNKKPRKILSQRKVDGHDHSNANRTGASFKWK